MHGGSSPQALKAARIRLLELVNPALAVLAAATDPEQAKKEPAVALQAAKDILDRNGLKTADELILSDGGSLAGILRGRRAKRNAPDSDSSTS